MVNQIIQDIIWLWWQDQQCVKSSWYLHILTSKGFTWKLKGRTFPIYGSETWLMTVEIEEKLDRTEITWSDGNKEKCKADRTVGIGISESAWWLGKGDSGCLDIRHITTILTGSNAVQWWRQEWNRRQEDTVRRCYGRYKKFSSILTGCIRSEQLQEEN